MSNHIISMAYKRDLKTPMRKSVMVLLADKASDDGSGIYASKKTMADELCCSKQTVIDTIKGFVDEGLLKENGQRRNSNGFTVEYAIVVVALDAVPLVACHAARKAKGVNVDDRSKPQTSQPAGPVNVVDATGQPAGPKPSRTPHLKNTETARATSLPANWEPKPFGPDSKCNVIVDGWPPGEMETQVEHFRAHHHSKGSKFIDWQAAWKTWTLNSRNINRGSHGTTRQNRPQQEPAGSLARAVLRRKAGRSAGPAGLL